MSANIQRRLFLLLVLLVMMSAGVWAQTKTSSKSKEEAAPASAVTPVQPTDAAVIATPVSNGVANEDRQKQLIPPSADELRPNSKEKDKENSHAIKIGAGDLLEVKVFNVPELTADVRVNSEGEISLPLVGSIPLAGLTPALAEKEIARRLSEGEYLRNPQVSVFMKEYVTQGISLMGEVSKPGIYPLLGAQRLFDAISSAGGMTNKAGRTITVSRRQTPDQPLVVILDPDAAKNAHNNIEIYPGDTIVVAKAGVVYVVGEVTRPSGFIMDNNESLTVLQAIALAQGLTNGAKLNDSKIIRKTPNGLQEVPVPLKVILQGKAPDVAMQAEDILFVPTAASKNAARRSLEAIVQVATGMAIYRR